MSNLSISFLRIIAVVVVVTFGAAACSSSSSLPSGSGEYDGVLIEPPEARPDFVLTDTSGATYDFRFETAGKLTLLYFGYTYCPDICPVHLAQLASVLETLPDVRREAVVVFVTVDPARDTGDRVRSFLDAFSVDFVGLVGTQAEIDTAQRAARVPIAVREGDGEDYTVGHAGQVIAYAPNDLAYTMYPFGTRQSHWIHDLPLLLRLTE